MALAPAGPVIPDLQVGQQATCTQAVGNAVNVLVQKFWVYDYKNLQNFGDANIQCMCHAASEAHHIDEPKPKLCK